MSKREYRYLREVELRESSDGKPIVSGYAVVFAPAQSEDLGGFVEQVDRHAVDSALNEDVRALWNHNSDHVLARTKSSTLNLTIDDRGLKYEFEAPDTQAGRDLVTSMRRGDVDASSFGFITNKDSWNQVGGKTVRTLLDVTVFDVSPVAFPAYPNATSQVRSLFPDGKPEYRNDEPEHNSSDCECDCPECEAGNCAECSDSDCTDPECRCSGMKDDMRRLRLRIAEAKAKL